MWPVLSLPRPWAPFGLAAGPFLLCAILAERYAIRWWLYYVAFALLGIGPFLWITLIDPWQKTNGPLLVIPLVGGLVYWAVSGRRAGCERQRREWLALDPPTTPGH